MHLLNYMQSLPSRILALLSVAGLGLQGVMALSSGAFKVFNDIPALTGYLALGAGYAAAIRKRRRRGGKCPTKQAFLRGDCQLIAPGWREPPCGPGVNRKGEKYGFCFERQSVLQPG